MPGVILKQWDQGNPYKIELQDCVDERGRPAFVKVVASEIKLVSPKNHPRKTPPRTVPRCKQCLWGDGPHTCGKDTWTCVHCGLDLPSRGLERSRSSKTFPWIQPPSGTTGDILHLPKRGGATEGAEGRKPSS